MHRPLCREPAALGPFQPGARPALVRRGPTPAWRSEEKPNRARWSRAPSGARRSACAARPCRPEPGARDPLRHPEHRRLPTPSFHQSLWERLLSLPGCLFPARAENAARPGDGAGAPGEPGRGSPSALRSASEGPSAARGAPRRHPPTSCTSPTLQVAGPAPGPPTRPGSQTPSPARVEGASLAWRRSCLRPPNPAAPAPDSNLPGLV